jgi:hypothetical protein
MTHDEMIAVIQAHKDGKMIQFKQKDVDGWVWAPRPCWNFSSHEYRIKPEPMEIWVNVYDDGETSCPYKSKDDAQQSGINAGRRTVKFREALDE